MTHLMIDFETLATDPGAVVLSCGSVFFNKISILKTHHFFFDLQEQIKLKRTINSSTLHWWLAQNQEAKAVFDQVKTAGRPLATWAKELSEELSQIFVLADNGDVKVPEIRVWGNGATFDISIADNIFNTLNMPSPWKYSSVRCYRTVKTLFDVEKYAPFVGTKHDALADATYQANCLMQFFRAHPELDK